MLLAWHSCQVSAQAYQQIILEWGSGFDPEQHGVWTLADWDGDGTPDLCYIKTENQDSGKIEVTCKSGASKFEDGQHYVTGLDAFQGNKGTFFMRDYDGDGRADLIFIKIVDTGTSSVEVHVLTASSNYQQFAIETGTFITPEDNGVWSMSDAGDLVYIKTRDTGTDTIEVHISSRSSGYKHWVTEQGTGFPVGDSESETWRVAPKSSSGQFPDLYYIKTSGGVKHAEVHAVTAASIWKTHNIDVESAFPVGQIAEWMMVDWTHGDYPDLAYIKVKNTGTGKVEVHIAQHGCGCSKED